MFNCVYTLKNGPIYDPITWKGFLGIAIPFGLILVGVILWFLLEFLTKKKLKAQGHTKIVEILEGNRLKYHYEKQDTKDKEEAQTAVM